MQVHIFKISCDTQKWRICVYTIRALTTLGWDKLPVYLSRPGTWLPLDGGDVGVWLTSVSLAPARGWTFTTRALKGSHQVPWGNAQSFPEEPSLSPDFLGGHCDEKKSPLSPSNLNSCHINNFIRWDVQIPDNGSQLCNVKHQERKHSVCLSRFIWPQNLAKLIFHGTQFEKRCSSTPNSNCVTHSSGLNSENLTRAVVLHQADKRHHNLPFLHPQVQPQLTVHQVWQ